MLGASSAGAAGKQKPCPVRSPAFPARSLRLLGHFEDSFLALSLEASRRPRPSAAKCYAPRLFLVAPRPNQGGPSEREQVQGSRGATCAFGLAGTGDHIEYATL